MGIFVKVLIGIGILVVIILIVAAVVKKDYAVQRNVIINKPVSQVFDYLKHIKNQDNYNKWVMVDPGMKKSFKGEDGTVGFAYAWDSQNKQAGAGEQTIKGIIDNREIELQIVFIRPFAGVADSKVITVANPDGSTKVTQSFKSKMPYPMNIALLFINMDNVLGKDLETSLHNLKTILEK